MMLRLASKHPTAVCPLTYQYRMNEAICRVSSESIYGGRLKCGSDEVRYQTLKLLGFPSSLPPGVSKSVYPWLRAVIDPSKAVIFADTDNVKRNPRPPTARSSSLHADDGTIEPLEERVGGRTRGNVTNPTEAKLVIFILQGLLASGVPESSIGVISPFRAQVGSKVWPFVS